MTRFGGGCGGGASIQPQADQGPVGLGSEWGTGHADESRDPEGTCQWQMGGVKGHRGGRGDWALSTESGSEEELSRGADGASATESNSERKKKREREGR